MIRPFKEIEFSSLEPDYGFAFKENNKDFYILATSEKGELFEPKVVKDFDDAYRTYGDGNMIELIRSVYQVSQETPLRVVRIDTEDKDSILTVIRNIDFRYLLLDHEISLMEDFELILRIIDQMKEELEYKGILSHLFLNIEQDYDRRDYAELKEILNNLYSYGETDAGVFLSLISDDSTNFVSSGLYAGLCISQDITESPINKPLYYDGSTEYVQMRKNIYAEEANKTIDFIVSLRDSFHYGPVFTTDNILSTDNPNSQYRSFTNLKAVSYVLDYLKDVTRSTYGVIEKDREKFVSDVVSIAVESLIQSNKVKSIRYELYEEEIGYFHLDIEIMPHFAIHYIYQSTKVSDR